MNDKIINKTKYICIIMHVFINIAIQELMELVEDVRLELQSEEYSDMLLENSVSLGEILLSWKYVAAVGMDVTCNSH